MHQAADGQTESIWMRSAEVPKTAPLTADAHADVAIVGAGIAGLTTAYLLRQEGLSVVLLDVGPVGGGETGRTTAHLSNALDDRFYVLEALHGEKGARLAAESHAAAIDTIERIVRDERIADCHFQRLDGYLFLPIGEDPAILEEELRAARRAGLDVERAERAPVRAFDTGPALCFRNQAQFHPLRYLAELTRAVQRMGGRIFSGARAKSVTGGDGARVETEQGPSVFARHVVVATNTPINDVFAIHTKQAAYRTYAVSAPVRSDVFESPLLLWDTSQEKHGRVSPGASQPPYHYVRLALQEDGRAQLVVGGEDHKTGQTDSHEEHWENLERWARAHFPEITSFDGRWSGQVMEPVDQLAFIGRNPGDKDNVYIATGDSGHGLTHGTIAGLLLTDLIVGRLNPWETLYDPARKSLRAARAFVSENLNVAAQYAEWVTPGELSSPHEVARGQGAIVRRGLRKIACYRDDYGELHEHSAVCPHLGCIVHWNEAERTWDCPCHGSRFDAKGAVLNGPAISPLGPAEEPAS